MTPGHQPRENLGFANAETANVVLWLENNRPLYDAVKRLENTWYTGPMNYGGDRGECLHVFARAIRGLCRRTWIELVTPDGFELAQVDWAEIAAHWVEP